MPVVKKSPFYWRSFVTFYMVLSIVVIATSGIVLYIAPPGRIANWSSWAIGALTKANWQAVHTIFAFVFVVMAALHVYFNWRVIVGYVRTRLGEGMRRKRELALSSALAVGVLAATIAGMPPFRTVMTVGETLKNSWATTANEPPVPHAETWTLAKFAESTRIPIEEATANLAKAGIVVSGADATLQDLASQHGVTPQQVYALAEGRTAAPAEHAASGAGGGGGYGRKTVQQVCDDLHIPVETGLERLRAAGFDAKAASTIREIAVEKGTPPFEVAKIIGEPSPR